MMTDPDSDRALPFEELRHLRRHGNRTIVAFLAFQVYMITVFASVFFFDLSAATEGYLMAILFAAVIPIGMLQFSKRCPRCGANLEWQVRMGIPRNCKRCGARFTKQEPPA